MLPKTCTVKSNPKPRWYERLAARLERKGKKEFLRNSKGKARIRIGGQRMIYRDADRLDRAGDNSVRDKYLERFYVLSTPWIGVYIHRFWASDPDGLHDHPWSSFSWVLAGGYLERIAGLAEPANRTPGSKHFRPAQESHRIMLRDGDEPGSCWTVFIRFRRKRLWGFYRDGDWEPALVQSGSDE